MASGDTGRRANPSQKHPGRRDVEILAYVEACERDLGIYATNLRENAHLVYLGIKKTSRLPKGVDKIPAARRQRRAMLKMAAGAETAAAAANQFRFSWYQSFGRPGSREGIKKTGIEFT